MLQWMGGSRRKVTTSRKSTYKRQKQYFEQRKRQLQQTAGLESYSDGKRSCTVQCENNRSLDILSLENVSTLAQEHKTSCTNARDRSEHDDLMLSHQDAHPSLVILTNEGITADQSEINEERSPSSYVTEAEYSEKVSIHLPDHNEDLVGNHDKIDSSKLSMMHQMSIIDLLGDGGANTNAEEFSSHAQEAHVAFSVEGLGQVETGTPVHSPKVPGRSSLNCFSPPKRARRQPIMFDHLDFCFHDLGCGVDLDFSPCGGSIDQLFCSGDIMNIVGNQNEKFINFRRPSPYDWNVSNLQGAFQGDDHIYNIQDSSRNIWNDHLGPSFSENSIDDLGEYESFSKNWGNERDVGFDDYSHCKDLWKQDLNFEGWDLHKKRSCTRRVETFNVKDPNEIGGPVLYPKSHIAEDLPGIIISDKTWCSDFETDSDIKDAANHFVREDKRESLSLLSEESCSSTAVRDDAAKKSNPDRRKTQV